MRKNRLCAKHLSGAGARPRTHDGTIVPENIDRMRGVDMTAAVLGTGRQVAVFVAGERGSASCAGIRTSRFEASQRIRQGVWEGFWTIGKDVVTRLTIHFSFAGPP